MYNCCMLSPKEKKEKKNTSISMRIPSSVAEMLRELAEAYNMSQAEAFEKMVRHEYELFQSKHSTVSVINTCERKD